MPDLATETTPNLLRELMARFDHAVFVALKTLHATEGKHMYVRRWAGNSHTCIGLLADQASAILKDYHGGEIELQED